MRITSYRAAVRYLESLIPADAKRKTRGTLRLERIEHLLRLIGNPERSFRSIHIGGTSGKGSTACITAAILKEAGYRVGLHLSPHLEKINERMHYNGSPISDKNFTALIRWIKPFVEKVGREGEYGAPSYFEALVAVSFEYFRRKNVDIAVVEVGLGGALDATNVLRPEVAVITNVDLDHTEILGRTVEKIARDKVGIIKKNIEVITAATKPAVLKIIKSRCRTMHTPLTVIGKNASYKIIRHNLKGLSLTIKIPNTKYSIPATSYQILATSLLGRHQAANIACAIAAVSKVQATRIQDTVIRRALRNLKIPGRLEIISLKAISYKLKAVLDGAHNPAKMRALAAALKELFPNQKITFIFAAKRNKDVKNMLRPILPLAEKIYLTRFGTTTDFGARQSTHPADLAKIVQKLKPSLPYEITQTSHQALKKALYPIPYTLNPVCITGSLYLVGEMRQLIRAHKKI